MAAGLPGRHGHPPWQGQFTGGAVESPLPNVSGTCTSRTLDLAVDFIFSLIIFFWAQADGLPKEEILPLSVEKQAAHGGVEPGCALIIG